MPLLGVRSLNQLPKSIKKKSRKTRRGINKSKIYKYSGDKSTDNNKKVDKTNMLKVVGQNAAGLSSKLDSFHDCWTGACKVTLLCAFQAARNRTWTDTWVS